MKISREMLHPDLQSTAVYCQQKMASYLFRSKWSTLLASKIIGAQISRGASSTELELRAEEKTIPTSDGEAQIRMKIYRPKGNPGPLPVMLYLHGGGYITGSPEVFEETFVRFIQRRPCVIVAPAYRTAFVKPFPAGFDDCYTTLLWLRDHADELEVDASNIIIAGHSAGGGMTAAVTLKARDTKDVDIAFQMPYYPMLDDRQPGDPARYIDVAGWSTKNNAFGWASYLKDLHAQNAEIPAYAAPARNEDYSDFPPTITFTGEYEPFYWETVDYVKFLRQAGVDVAFKVYKKCTHGPDMIVPESSLGKNAIAFSLDNYADFYDRYVVHRDQKNK